MPPVSDSMFTRCLFCHQAFPPNEALEHMPRGRRLAYDPERGRLWAVCERCGRWSLAPLAERWEALDELERICRGRARVLARTDHIALLRDGELEVVRVGNARLREEAWWRYGRDLLQRRRRSRVLRGFEVVAGVGILVATGVAAGSIFADGLLHSPLRWRQFGRVAWRGRSDCVACGQPLTELKFSQTEHLSLVPDRGGELALSHSCARCRETGGGHLLRGVEAEHVLRRSLAYHHFRGAAEGEIRAATEAIERVGSAAAVVGRVVAEETHLGGLLRVQNRERALALEISLNDAIERECLRLELRDWEARWRAEEEIAMIVDRELTPVAGLERPGGPANQGSGGSCSTW